MALLLAGAFGSSTKDERGVHHMAQNSIALSAIREAETIRVRLKIMDATLGAILKQNAPDLHPEWEELKVDLRRRGRERNAIVHGSWWLSDAYPSDLLLEERTRMLKYTVGDLDEVLNRTVAVWQRCHRFEMEILERKLVGPQFPGSTG